MRPLVLSGTVPTPITAGNGVAALNLGRFTQAVAGAAITLSAADSQNNYFITTGSPSGAGFIQFSRGVTAGMFMFVENRCLTDFTARITGAATQVSAGRNVIIYQDDASGDTATLDILRPFWPVQVGTASSTTATTTLAFTVPAGGIAVGRKILIAFGMGLAVGTISCADSKSNTYAVDVDISAATFSRSAVISATVTTALVSGDIITVTHPSVARKAMSVMSAVGINTGLDQTATGSGVGTTSPTTAATPTTTAANELLFSSLALLSVSGQTIPTLTPASGWTAGTAVATDANTAGHSCVKVFPVWQVVTATGAFTAAGTLSSSNYSTYAYGLGTYK